MPLWTSRLLSNTSATNAASHASGSARSPPDSSKTRNRLGTPSNPHTAAPTTNSEAGLNAGQSKPRTRSFTNAIPILLGGTNKKKNLASNDADSNPAVASAPSRRYDENELEVVVCATCDTKAKIPRNVSEYRCSTCLMINDLKIHYTKATLDGTNENDAANQSLSLERTRALAEACVKAYLSARRTQPKPTETAFEFFPVSRSHEQHRTAISPIQPLKHTIPSAIGTGRDAPSVIPSGACVPLQSTLVPSEIVPRRVNSVSHNQALSPRSNKQTTQLDGDSINRPILPPFTLPLPSPLHNLQLSGSPISPQRSHPDMMAISPRSPPLSTEDHRRSENKDIFKALESYIIKTFANFETLNSAFSFARARMADAKPHGGGAEHQKITATTEHSVPTISQISDLDAKTLLLGDIGENGLWWTGRNNSSPLPTRRVKTQVSSDQLKSVTQLRSPRVNWVEVSQWYDYILSVGSDWRDHVDSSTGLAPISDIIAGEVDACLADARLHVQRTLLKASENLLKRPGRPVKTPEDIRFLLILLANPLLHPDTSARFTGKSVGTPTVEKQISFLQPDSTVVPNRSVLSKGNANVSSWEQGHAFGIIKRIIGLMSNLPNDCHRHLTAWFARFDEDRFRVVVELVQGLVTHRFGRQHSRKRSTGNLPSMDAMPELATDVPAELHAALGLPVKPKSGADGRIKPPAYSDDWQVKAAARVMALLFAANKVWQGQRLRDTPLHEMATTNTNSKHHSQLLPMSQFYNTTVDYSDLVADFETWESSKGRFAFCQYPFFLSVSAKIRILEHDARRQMEVKAREAFFNSILRNKAMEQFLVLKVRRDCLVDDSLKGIGEVVGAGQEEIKKGLKIQFVGEEGVDAGGLRKEWFLLLVREIFDPNHGMFIYDDDSRLCYFNPDTFETSDQFFLVGALLGLAIYNSTILDVALPPFLFKKVLASGPSHGAIQAHSNRHAPQYTLEDLAEYRPSLARGLRQLLEFEGNVEETFCRDFVAEVDRYGTITQVPLCADGARKPVTNANRQQFVDAYIKFLLDTQVARQFEPFKRGFFKVCGGNALSLFQPEEIELLVRGSDEPLDVPTLKAVAIYENWRRGEQAIQHPEEIDLIKWFWEAFESAHAEDQRRLLSFVTGSDRIPAAGAASLVIKIQFAGKDSRRYPTARTCFNSLLLYKYPTKQDLVNKLWRAITESEGFGLK